jgi:hypothetical protein
MLQADVPRVADRVADESMILRRLPPIAGARPSLGFGLAG